MKTFTSILTTVLIVLGVLWLLGYIRFYRTEIQYTIPQPQIIQPQPSSGGGCKYPGEQPLRPTAKAVNVKWESVFGPRGPMEVDSGSGYEVQHVPVGMRIFWDGKYAWTMDGNRVKFSPNKGNRFPHQKWSPPADRFHPPDLVR
jgi:hypothetical protein